MPTRWVPASAFVSTTQPRTFYGRTLRHDFYCSSICYSRSGTAGLMKAKLGELFGCPDLARSPKAASSSDPKRYSIVPWYLSTNAETHECINTGSLQTQAASARHLLRRSHEAWSYACRVVTRVVAATANTRSDSDMEVSQYSHFVCVCVCSNSDLAHAARSQL
jgi:hypothetical protein